MPFFNIRKNSQGFFKHFLQAKKKLISFRATLNENRDVNSVKPFWMVKFIDLLNNEIKKLSLKLMH